MKLRVDSFYVFLLALCLLIIVGSLLVLRPHWGLMDDASLAYGLIPRMEKEGIFLESWRYAISDIGWGMFRPIYPLMAYLIYKPGLATAPWISFVVNALFSVCLLWGMARFWARLLKMNWREILLVNACFFYQYDLLQHPSLQEKIVILAGLLLLATAAWGPRKLLFPAFVVLTVIGFLTKASFVIYFGTAFIVLIGRVWGELKAKRAITFCALVFTALVGAAAVLILGKIAGQGTYTTGRYNFTNIWPNLVSVNSVFFLAPLALGAWMFLRSWRSVFSAPTVVAPWAGVVLFLLLFLPWGIGGYIQTIIGPLFSVLLCQIACSFLSRPRWRTGFFSAIGILAVIVCSYRVPTMLLRLHDLGKIVEGGGGFASETLNMPCMEGTDAMRTFLRMSGLSDPKVQFHPSLPDDMTGIWLYDSAMCPLPGRVLEPAGCTQEFLYRSVWKKSYRVVRLQCQVGGYGE